MTADQRPKMYVALSSGMRAELEFDQYLHRLHAIGTVHLWEGDGSPSAAFVDEALAHATIIITGWGVPYLDALEDWTPATSQLRLVAHAAGTVKSLVPYAAVQRGLLVSRANHSLVESVAEFTIGALIMARRRAFVAAERYRVAAPLVPIQTQRELRGSTIGIIGASAIGKGVMELLQPFGARILLADPYATEALAAHYQATLVDLGTLLAQSDIVSLHAPVTPETIGMLGAAQFAAMRDGALFVNTARARLVDMPALLTELQSGRLSALLDVTEPDEPLPVDSPFFALDNCTVLPHMAAVTRDARLRQSEICVGDVERFVASTPLLHGVDVAQWERMA
jgi:phosphoglycerate dehydrogenase-like enzyme